MCIFFVATFLVFDPLDDKLYELLLKAEPPRSYYNETPVHLPATLEWIPPTLWQLGMLHAYFHDEAIRQAILTLEPLQYEEELHAFLPHAESVSEVASLFDRATPPLSGLFFQVNQAICSLFENSDKAMLHRILDDIPPFDQWKLPPSYLTYPESPYNFYTALQDRALLEQVIHLERQAYEEGSWILYRGYQGHLTTLETGTDGNHALSFGSTLLGGTFFSIEATALTYAGSDKFLALKVTPAEMKQFFRVGPLHPFLQLLADGEMFHAHTKVASTNQHLHGYFMKLNRQCNDPIGYILTYDFTPQELEESFIKLLNP